MPNGRDASAITTASVPEPSPANLIVFWSDQFKFLVAMLVGRTKNKVRDQNNPVHAKSPLINTYVIERKNVVNDNSSGVINSLLEVVQ